MSEVEDDAESHQNDSVVAAEIKHKSNIPDDLIEKPAPETLPSLDRTLDAVREGLPSTLILYMV